MERKRLPETSFVSIKKWLDEKDDSYLLARHVILAGEKVYRKHRRFAKKMTEEEINLALSDLYKEWYIEKYKPDVIM